MVDSDDNRGKVIVVSGPSGVGKSTICREIVKRLDAVHLSISMTTRAIGPGEVDGRDYYFVSERQFRDRIAKGLLLEYAEVFGHLYGTPKDKVDEQLERGRSVILEIDVQGGKQVKTLCPEAVMVFVLPPSAKVLAERIDRRGRDDGAAVQQRLGGAGGEIAAAWQYYEHMVINEDLEQAIAEVIQIIRTGTAPQHSADAGKERVGES